MNATDKTMLASIEESRRALLNGSESPSTGLLMSIDAASSLRRIASAIETMLETMLANQVKMEAEIAEQKSMIEAQGKSRN